MLKWTKMGTLSASGDGIISPGIGGGEAEFGLIAASCSVRFITGDVDVGAGTGDTRLRAAVVVF